MLNEPPSSPHRLASSLCVGSVGKSWELLKEDFPSALTQNRKIQAQNSFSSFTLMRLLSCVLAGEAASGPGALAPLRHRPQYQCLPSAPAPCPGGLALAPPLPSPVVIGCWKGGFFSFSLTKCIYVFIIYTYMYICKYNTQVHI